MPRRADPDAPEPPLANVLAAALAAWLCVALTVAALTLRDALLGPAGLAVGALLAASTLPFALWPERPATLVGYLIACLVALTVIPIGLWLGLT